jgi:unsaturated rhamnogalacturonyl hydrolase
VVEERKEWAEMTVFFPKQMSAAARLGYQDTEGILSLITNRYIGENPPLPYVYRIFNRGGFRQHSDGRYDINLKERFPGAKYGQFAYAYGIVWSDAASEMELSVSCYGPTMLWVNEEMVYKSSIIEEVNVTVVKTVKIQLKSGRNALFLRFCHAPSGFGCVIGSARSKWSPLDVLSPFQEREGQAGWVYSEATGVDLSREEGLPDLFSKETESPLNWHPKSAAYNEAGEYSLFWSSLHQPFTGNRPVQFRGSASGEMRLFIDGQCMWEGSGGEVETTASLSFGSHTIVVISGGHFVLKAACKETELSWDCPHPIQGYGDAWLCLGGFDQPPVHIAHEQPSIVKLYENGSEPRYWRAGTTDDLIRPYIENRLFGRWNYPVGVTLYGLLQTGRYIGREDIVAYAGKHIQTCVDAYSYAAWNARQFGYPTINQQLMEMNMLDDCGSCGSSMLEAKLDSQDIDWLPIADDIADYIMNRQERKEDGVIYRKQTGYFMENTLWADDLYMSVPFLIRYAKLRNRANCLDEAVRQFLLFRHYLFMPDVKLMSHVYDFKYNTPTYVNWGRGNGWVLFSLSELLTELPKTHVSYGEILSFFLEISLGVLEVQGVNGLWHQVLTEAESYEETSCTAMFVYSFARGLLLGLFPQPEPFEQAMERGWQAIANYAVDHQGNVYGVCIGSRYSFSSDYYKHELPWRINDTHGIGIVLLAGVEVAKLQAARSNSQ